MPTILDLPDEVHRLIGEQLSSKVLYSCVRVCRSFYSVYIPCFWSDIRVKQYKANSISPDQLRANAHRVETINYSSTLTNDYYTIVYPRLQTIKMSTYVTDRKDPNYLQVQPHQKVQFARLHPTIRKLSFDQPGSLSREFWEVVETEWKDFESLDLSGVVLEDVVDVFWRVCDRLKCLSLTGVRLPKDLPVSSTLSFSRLRQLTIVKYLWSSKDIPYHNWPLQLLEQVKKSEGLRYLKWDVTDIPFPSRMVMDAFKEGCWPELCEVDIAGPTSSDQDLAKVLRMLPSQRLKRFGRMRDELGPLTYGRLRGLYCGHLQELKIGRCTGITSSMTQELLTECVHLVYFDAPHIFVRDIATALKPWGCSRLEILVTFIAKQKDDEGEWEGKVFKQISKLGRLQTLDLQRFPHPGDKIIRSSEISFLQTLDFRLSPSSNPEDVCGYGNNDNTSSNSNSNSSSSSSSGGHLSCWSSLVQLRVLIFDDDRQTLGMEEALWMTEHWRDLWCICGDFKGVKGDNVNKLEQLFSKKDVLHLKH
ncbi:hypothetical protein BKA57DRAFT_461769 [Linnemannia elongata]|nr:hypothetical protein BKA57DRAFT_461769 [Linnemannia elongata]